MARIPTLNRRHPPFFGEPGDVGEAETGKIGWEREAFGHGRGCTRWLAMRKAGDYRGAMASEFNGPRTAIVTGGAKRIGAEISRALGADGWHVLIHFNRSLDAAKALAAEIGSANIVQAELAGPTAAETIMAALDGLPPPRILINNASRFVYDSAADFDVDGWDANLDINLRAPALLSRVFAARVGGGPGLIVNLLDAKVAAPNPDFFTYTISKLGLAGLTELCARAFAPAVRVCGIAPSLTLVSGPQSRDNFAAVHHLNALGRGVEVGEIIAALRFIIATPSFTGQNILLDGGQRFLALPRDVQFIDPDRGRRSAPDA